MNRLTRDAILNRALDLLDSARLNEKDRGGEDSTTILASALSIGWLQDSLDLAINLYPLQGTIKSEPYTFTRGVTEYALPSRYIIDYRDGLILGGDKGRMQRRGFAAMLNLAVSEGSYGKPKWYTVKNNLLLIRPAPNETYTGTLYFYQLPTALTANEVPNFPSDFMLVEYVKMRGLEWLREIPQDSANKYLVMTMAQLLKAGLGQEAEEDQINPDRDAFPGEPAFLDSSRWMGSVGS